MEIPLELKDAVEALDHPIRVRVVEYLYDGRVATYTELLNMLGVRKGSLTYHLKVLGQCGVVFSKQRLDELGDFHRAHYVLSPWGRRVVDGLLESYNSLVYPDREKLKAVAETRGD
ncbi:MAG: helix-turn-helix domain-containing protein [Candidatus Bathyarchaeota archaeon]|nr:helix-turn-helix domain-containing protein [Candidatus Bathyarchaeota archaeon]